MIRKTTLMSVFEVSEHLQVSQRTVRRWIADGRLRAARVGGHYRIREQDVDYLVFGQALGRL